MVQTMQSNFLEIIRQKKPLVHFLTNYVTVNDVANITLAAGGSPVMADAAEETADIASLSSAVVINMGTPNRAALQGMLTAGKRANDSGIPVVFDPVGAGASAFRNEIAATLLANIRFAVIKGNISEIRSLLGETGPSRGVDAVDADIVTEERLQESVVLARRLAAKTGAVVVISGPVDIIADKDKAWRVNNGHVMMASITGSGCMAGAVVGVHVGAFPENPLEAALHAVVSMGICGEIAWRRLGNAGTATYRILLIDAMSQLDQTVFDARCLAEQLVF